MTKKVCIFCGNTPQKKNREHVLPRWLLRLTGKPSRRVGLGRKWSMPDFPERNYSFDRFTFPACEACNSHYAELEERVNKTINRMLNRQPVLPPELSDLLDWLDKVRVGLWLGFTALNGNHHNIDPQFHISSRMGTRDRMVCIYEDTSADRGLWIMGCESPIFQLMPSCFVLSINKLHLFSASSSGLLLRQFGLPHEKNRKLLPDREGYSADIEDGTNQLNFPLHPYTIVSGGAEIYQPIIPDEYIKADGNILHAIDKEYAHKMLIDMESGRGKIFVCHSGQPVEYTTVASNGWIPKPIMPRIPLMAYLAFMSGDWQRKLYVNIPSMENISLEEQDRIRTRASTVLQVHDAIMDQFRNYLHQLFPGGMSDLPALRKGVVK